MITRNKIIWIMAVAILFIAAGLIAEDQPWYDMKNCEFCKSYLENPELINHMTCEQHKINNGVLTICIVDPAFMDAFTKANDNIHAVADRAMVGQPVKMCGSCTTMGTFFMRGASMEEILIENGMIWILTADDPELITDIHAWADKNDAEMAKMMMDEK